MNYLLRLRLPVLTLLAILSVGLVLKYNKDNDYLLLYADQFIVESDSQTEKVVKLVSAIRENVRSKRNQGAIFLPIFRFLRPTAVQVARSGSGDCADKSRLLINLLHLHGIEASKVALYDDQGIPQHAVVEVHIGEDQKMAVDALYGLYFPRTASETFYSVRDITNDESILRNRITELLMSNTDNYKPSLQRYPFHKYTYNQPRSINWDKSEVLKFVYKISRLIIGERVNSIERPYFVERPVLMILYSVLTIMILIAASYVPAVIQMLYRHNTTANSQDGIGND